MGVGRPTVHGGGRRAGKSMHSRCGMMDACICHAAGNARCVDPGRSHWRRPAAPHLVSWGGRFLAPLRGTLPCTA